MFLLKKYDLNLTFLPCGVLKQSAWFWTSFREFIFLPQNLLLTVLNCTWALENSNIKNPPPTTKFVFKKWISARKSFSPYDSLWHMTTCDKATHRSFRFLFFVSWRSAKLFEDQLKQSLVKGLTKLGFCSPPWILTPSQPEPAYKPSLRDPPRNQLTSRKDIPWLTVPSCHPIILQPHATFCCLIKVFFYLTWILANLSITIVSSSCQLFSTPYCSNPFQLSLSLPRTRFDFTWNLAYVITSLKFRLIECWTLKELQS